MSGEKFLLTIRNGKIFSNLISGMNASFDEREMLSQCLIARANVIPSEKFIEIFLEVQGAIDKKLLSIRAILPVIVLLVLRSGLGVICLIVLISFSIIVSCTCFKSNCSCCK